MNKLLFTLVLTIISNFVFGQTVFTINGIKYTTTGINTVEVSVGGTYTGDIIIPSFVRKSTINYSVTSIGQFAFESCVNLTSISIPNSVTNISDQAFYNCTGLTSISMSDSVKSIGRYAFSHCSGLTSVSIPNSVTFIAYQAFSHCTSLKRVILSDSLTSIESDVFNGCDQLNSISIPKNVETLKVQSFSLCSKLSYIFIPALLTNINSRTFYGCTSLKNIFCFAFNPPTLGSSPFYNVSIDSLFVPMKSKAKYSTNSGWKIYKNIIEMKLLTNNTKKTVCEDSIQITEVKLNFNYPGKVKFKWSPAAYCNNDTISNPLVVAYSDTSIYVVTAIFDNGYFMKDTLKIIKEKFNANVVDYKFLNCGDSVQIDKVLTNYTGNGTVKYKWTPSLGLNNDTIANPIVSVFQNTKYVVVVTTTEGCTISDSVQVIVNPLIVDAGVDQEFLCGTTFQLGVYTNYLGSGKLTYKWTPNIGLNNDDIPNPIVKTFSPIEYTVTVSTPNGCTSTDIINLKPLVGQNQQLRLVSVNADNRNLIVWNDLKSYSADSVIIYSSFASSKNIKYIA